MSFFVTHVKEGTVRRSKLSKPSSGQARPALSGALCGPGTESKWSPFLGHISSVSSRHTCDVVHLTVVQRVKDQPFIGKVIMLKTESLFTSSGENAGEPSLATSGNVAAKISLDKMHLTFLAYTCSKSLWNVCL